MFILFVVTLVSAFLVLSIDGLVLPRPVPCPSDLCKCRSRDVICTDKNVEKIAWDFPATTTKISLANNSLFEVNSSSFLDAAPTLESLDLSRNHLSLLPGDLLNEIPEVIFLNFSRNKINIEFPERGGPLMHNAKLITLDLSHNRIQFIAPFLFQGLKHLQNLYLDGNLLTDFRLFYFTDLPQLSTISLSDNRIQTLTFGIQSKIKTIDVSGNTFRFTNSSQYFLSTPDVQEMKIGHHGLNYYPNSFSGMKFLHKVKLVDFSQRLLSSELFRPSRILTSVDVSGGSLERAEFQNYLYFHSLTFTDLPNMTSLLVTSCQSFEKTALKFINVPNISEVKLMKLPALLDFNSSFTFSDVNGLKTLVLSFTSISRLANGMFDNVPQLETLDLSYNRINIVESTAILSLKKLKSLNLRGNLLVSLSSRFLESKSLLSLSLSYNLIKEVSRDALDALPDVTSLRLDFNPISHPPPIAKKGLALNLEGVDKWDCNCELYDFIFSEHVINSCRNTSTSLCHVCDSPPKYKGQTVFALQHDCATKGFPTWWIIVIVLVVSVMCVGVIAAFFIWKMRICKEKKETSTRIPSYYTPPQERARKPNSNNSTEKTTFRQEGYSFTRSPARLEINECEKPQDGAFSSDLSGDEVFVTS